jgi:thymidylate synthase ThyX
MIKAEIVADSLAPNGRRLTTFVLTYPRFIHAEFMTHRMLSRNASSSRAIPVKKSIDMVVSEPVIPLAFTKNQKGMQGGAPLDGEAHEKAVAVWLKARDAMVDFARQLADLEVHKQYANRLLEPFANITVVASATEWDNFFALRCHKDAQPEIHALANKMYDLRFLSKPVKAYVGYWHLPLLSESDIDACKAVFGVSCLRDSQEATRLAIKRSVAKCARVSYLNHDGTSTTIEQDVDLYNRLVINAPIHASPAEHQAQARDESARNISYGNFNGWLQYRKNLSNECVEKFEKEIRI